MSSRNINFEKRLPRKYQEMSGRHWSGDDAIFAASEFLCQYGSRVLDIGSGVGKFCILGASRYPDFVFTGVEKREDLVQVSNKQMQEFDIENCIFKNCDIREVDFSQYDSFYFFNSFLELIDNSCIMDEKSEVSEQEYFALNEYLFSALGNTKAGTRLVIYHGSDAIIPTSFKLVDTKLSNLLKFYIKEDEFIQQDRINVEKLNKYIEKLVPGN